MKNKWLNKYFVNKSLFILKFDPKIGSNLAQSTQDRPRVILYSSPQPPPLYFKLEPAVHALDSKGEATATQSEGSQFDLSQPLLPSPCKHCFKGCLVKAH